MKNTMTTQWTSAVAIAFMVAATSLSAQEKDGTGQADAAIAELQNQYRTWGQTEILPKLSEWKAGLDAAMSSEDLQTLNTLRAEAKKLRVEIQESRVGLRKAWNMKNDQDVKAFHTRLSEAKKKLIDVVDALTPLVVEYRGTLESIGKEARPVVKKWRKEGRNIFKEWKEEYGNAVTSGYGKRKLRLHFRKTVYNLFGPTVLYGSRAARFMLWDGELPIKDVSNVPESNTPSLK